MSNSFFQLIQRDIKKTLNFRAFLIWISLSGLCLFFFIFSNGRYDLVENGTIDFMSLFLPQIIFGPWAILSVYYDLISSDREHNVLDCILCSGIKKKTVFLSKMLTSLIVSLVLSLIYLLPITLTIISITKEINYIVVLIKYFLPLWGYIMVFSSLGILISVIARSSKAALIWSLACGLILMPRFFMLLIEGLGTILRWSQTTKDWISLISPGVLMSALSDFTNTEIFLTSIAGFSLFVFLSFILGYVIFINQDEWNYGE